MKILDGGMGRQLKANGAPFRQPEWSALALIEAPEAVVKAHRQFVAAGAQVITTNAYAVVPFHVGEQRFEHDGFELIRKASQLARGVADESTGVSVAGCLPPLFGSYVPGNFEPEKAPRMLATFIKAQDRYVDLFLAETQSCAAEIKAVQLAMRNSDKPLWVSCSLMDDQVDVGTARLRSGERLDEVISQILNEDRLPEAVLFNCSQPEVMHTAIRQARSLLSEQIEVGVYANAFAPKNSSAKANSELSAERLDLDPESYLTFAKGWAHDGATIIGGCCGVGAEHIKRLSEGLSK